MGVEHVVQEAPGGLEASASGRTVMENVAAGRRGGVIALRRGRRGLMLFGGGLRMCGRGLMLCGRKLIVIGRKLMVIGRGPILNGRRLVFPILVIFISLIVSCGTEVTDKTAPDSLTVESRPEAVVELIFAAAREGDPGLLDSLCDPEGRGDIETRRICDYAAGFDREGEFPMFWGMGKVAGPAMVADSKALVPILFGPRGDRRDTLELVKRGEKWYLLRFAR